MRMDKDICKVMFNEVELQGVCKRLGEQITKDYEGKAVVGKVNVDEEGELAQAFGVMSIPTIVLVKDGKVVKQLVGARPKEELEEIIKAY